MTASSRYDSTAPVRLDKLAYSLDSFAEAVDMSKEFIRQQIAADRLVPSYAGSKPLILAEEGRRWLQSLPNEKDA